MVSSFSITSALAALCLVFITSTNAYAADTDICQWTNNPKELRIKQWRAFPDPSTNVDIKLTHGSYVSNFKDGETQYSLTQHENTFYLLNGRHNTKNVVYIIEWSTYPDSMQPGVKKSYFQLSGPAHCHLTIDGQDGKDGNGVISKVSVQELKPLYD